MLEYAIGQYMQAKGIQYMVPYLQKKGFAYHAARHAISNKHTGMRLDVVEKLCLALDCTPNDILIYRPSSKDVPEDHPLRSLDAARYHNEINEGMQHLDAAELEELKATLRHILDRKRG